jgi:hypothetical protein
MKIQRSINGMKFNIQLLPDELIEAFFEQQHIFDIEDVVEMGEEFDNEELIEMYGSDYQTILNNKEEIANKMRKFIDNFGLNWSEARDDAVRDVIKRKQTAVTA